MVFDFLRYGNIFINNFTFQR